ncbi:hypothetical protein [Pectobacterium brasiliense]|uniref:hypothetical protein n=1 Tax=Pectobacterium brasiliense TaxID=180957 RepID=UPI00057D2919|nr:hypothetical protein [Pectobacterium brasiliense]KHS76262.1 hypothetical protein RC79_06655 [Pectobacterium brasiliense]KHT09785.1 hypothetical protein RC92_06600 [Pectobacterium brasiliense]
MINIFLEEIRILSVQSISKDRLNAIVQSVDDKLQSISSKRKDKLLDESIVLLMNSIKEEKIRSAIGFSRFILYGGFKNPINAIKKKVFLDHQNIITKQKH